MGFEPSCLGAAQTLQAQLQKEADAKAAVLSACDRRDLDTLRSAVKAAAGVGLGDDVPEVKQGADLVKTIETELGLVEAIKAATAARDLAPLKAALAAAAAVSPEHYKAPFSEANATLGILEKMEACKAALSKAAAAQDVSALTAALGDASSLGVEGPELDAAKRP
ncbi:hypothetical protein JL721_3650 [Aureococcus anophagefferens]|nr:hypothetical protein JL721_3650 [Aureococcus anophagefferens]